MEQLFPRNLCRLGICLMLGLARCCGPECCCDALVFINALPPASKDSCQHRYHPAWRARVAELLHLHDNVQAKVQAIRRIGAIMDTSLVKHWWLEEDEKQSA